MPRETTISKVLLPLLDQYPSIDIPGLGNIGYQDLPSIIDEESHTLYPPMRTLVFSNTLTEENSVYDLIPDTLTKKELKQFNNGIDFAVNELINLGKTKLKGVATLERDQAGNINITNISKAARGPLQYLPTLQLTPMPAKVEETSVSSASVGTSAQDKPAITEDPVPIKDGAATKTPTTPYVSPYARTSESSKWKSYLAPVIIGLLALLVIGYFVRQSLATKSTDSNTNNTSVEAHQQNSIGGSKANASSKEGTIPDKYEGVLTEEILSNGCTIVIGSFDSRANAIAKSNEVAQMGYEMMEVPAGKPYRAIIKFDCSQHELDNYMLEVRDRVESKAWYLSPEGYDVSR